MKLEDREALKTEISKLSFTENAKERMIRRLSEEPAEAAARRSCGKHTLIAAALALVLLIGVFLGGSRLGWFTQVSADEADELVIDFNWSVVRLNRNLPDGYEVHLQSEYFSPDVDYSIVDPYRKIDYRDPANFPIPVIQVVNQEGQRVLEFWSASKNDTNRYLNDFQERIEMANGGDTGISFITKDGRDYNGNRFVFIKEDFYIDPEENPDGFVAGIDHRYTMLVDLAESEYSAIIIVGYGSEEEISRLYGLVNVRLEYDYDQSNLLPRAAERFEESVKRGEFEITW